MGILGRIWVSMKSALKDQSKKNIGEMLSLRLRTEISERHTRHFYWFAH